MPVFPDLASTGFTDIRFYSHVPGGYQPLVEYWDNHGMCVDHDTLWYYQRYTRKGVVHTVLVAARPVKDAACADIQIRIVPGEPSEVGVIQPHKKGHRMTTNQFLGMFDLLIGRKKKDWPLPFHIRFTRRVEFPKGILGLSGSGLKLTRMVLEIPEEEEKGLVRQIDVTEEAEGVATLTIALRPSLRLSGEEVSDIFFTDPIKDLTKLSESVTALLQIGAGERKSIQENK